MIRILIVFFSLLFPLSIPALCVPDWVPCGFDCERDWTLQVRFAYFDLDSNKVTKIYPNGWLDYQVEAAKRVTDNIEIWTSVSWTGKNHGHLPDIEYGVKNETKIHVLPISVGIKVFFPICSFLEVYIGGGVCYSYLSIKNHSRLLYDSSSFYSSDGYYYYKHSDGYNYDFSKSIYKSHANRSAWGGVGKVGLQYAMSLTTFLDVFAEYYSQNFHFSRHYHSSKRDVFLGKTNFSGFKYGAGFGVYF